MDRPRAVRGGLADRATAAGLRNARSAAGSAAWCYRLNRREARVARRNLELIAPGLAAGRTRTRGRCAILRATGSNLMETLRIWTRPRADNLRAGARGARRRAAATRRRPQGRGVILAAPHFGNWELLIEYLASREPFSLVYRVPEKRFGDVFLRLARGGENVHLVPAETNAMRPLFRALKAGETVGITPDQQPKQGGGEFAPFFGLQALTLTPDPEAGRAQRRAGAVRLGRACVRAASTFTSNRRRRQSPMTT